MNKLWDKFFLWLFDPLTLDLKVIFIIVLAGIIASLIYINR